MPILSMQQHLNQQDAVEAAIAEGSTMVRVGTAIFGARNT